MDSHGQSEVAFAFCHLLGTVRLMACLKRIKYERLYLPREKDRRRLSESGGVFARPIRWDLIEQQYDEMVKAAVAFKRDTATAEAILKRYNSYNLTHPTYKALAEVGKAEKSIFLCEYLPSQETQHEVQEGLNVVENWSSRRLSERAYGSASVPRSSSQNRVDQHQAVLQQLQRQGQ